MNPKLLWCGLIPFALLAACGGGGGGGVSSTPTPSTGSPTPSGGTPTPSGGTPAPSGGTPAPTTNTDIGDLQVNQTFSADSGYIRTRFNLATGGSTPDELDSRSISIAYNASSDSYTLNGGARTVEFKPVNIVDAQSAPGRVTYQRQISSSNAERLLLFTRPISGPSNRYVGMGTWQSIVIDAGANSQFSDLDMFVFGFRTEPAQVPRSGFLNYATDLFAVVTYPGDEPLQLVSDLPGTFTVDLARGVFSSHNRLKEEGLREGGATGAIYFDSAGYLSSADNALTGTFQFRGASAHIYGDIEASFFGPSGQELGAVFAGNGGGAGTINGALTGQLATSNLVGLALADQPDEASYLARGTGLNSRVRLSDGDADFGLNNPLSSIAFTSTSVQMPGVSSDLPGLDFSFARAATNSHPGYLSWTGKSGDYNIALSLNDAEGAGLELTYANFGSASWATKSTYFAERQAYYFRYGLPTTQGVLLARTGTASYSGVIIGEASNQDSGHRYAVGGTSAITVDFGGRGVTGTFAMNGVLEGATTSTDFGTWILDGEISSIFGFPDNLTLLHETEAATATYTTYVQGEFYGPNGEEIGIDFQTILPPAVLGEYLNVGGVTVARQN